MHRNRSRLMGLAIIAAFQAIAAGRTTAAPQPSVPFPAMQPLNDYLMGRSAEIALARSAAPSSISKDAEIRILGRRGYETVAKGINGFVCLVERSWTSDVNDPDFWNPRLRAPICFNGPAARTDLPITLKKTALLLAGRTKAQMAAAINVAFDKKELPVLERGAMCYMMSRQGFLNSRDGHWHPHLMFFVPLTPPDVWGAGMTGAPLYGVVDKLDRLTVFLVPVARWSDGTMAAMHH